MLSKHLSKIQLLISGGSGILLAAVAYPVILILYGEAYRNAAWSLILLIPGVVAWSVSKLLSNTLTYNRNMASFVAKVAVCGCLLNILLNYVFINVILIGINGASIASSLSYFFVALLIGLKTRGVS